MSADVPRTVTLDDDARQLKALGYNQELERSWSGFTNFAISFSIISILAGCFTTYGQAWNNGGPIAISIGWPVICAFILVVGFCMSEILSSFPTAGGIYYWSLRLGGPGWGWFTGWFNLVGLIGVVASVDYGARPLRLLHDRAVRLGLRRVQPDEHLRHLRHLPRRAHPPQPLPGAHPRVLEQHVGVPAHRRPGRDRRDPDLLDAARPSEPVVRVHAPHQQLRVLQRPQPRLRLLVLRPSARLPPHPVHPDGLRRLRPPLGGDRGAPRRPRRAASGRRSSGPRSAAGSCCCCSRSPRRTSTSSTTSRRQPVRIRLRRWRSSPRRSRWRRSRS